MHFANDVCYLFLNWKTWILCELCILVRFFAKSLSLCSVVHTARAIILLFFQNEKHNNNRLNEAIAKKNETMYIHICMYTIAKYSG